MGEDHLTDESIRSEFKMVDRRLASGAESFLDHETRLRTLEEFKAKVGGQLTLLTWEIPIVIGIATFLIGLFIKYGGRS